MKSKQHSGLAVALFAVAAGSMFSACMGGGGGGGASDGTTTSTQSAASSPGAAAAGDTTASAQPAAPAATGTEGTTGATGAGGSTGTTVAAGTPATTTPATAATPAATVASGSATGTIVPLYTYPTDASWAAVAAAKTAHPSVPVIAVVNPSNGPGAAKDPAYTAGIQKLTAAGVKVMGYDHTSYGARATAEVEADIDSWHSFYPGVTGIFFDEQANAAGHEAYYKSLTAYAKSHGMDFTVGNPGSDATASYVGTVDVELIYESASLPALSYLAGWHTGYDRHNFGIIPYGVASFDPSYVQAAAHDVGYIYIQSDAMPNPWDSVPAYLDTLVASLTS
jgi:hypothetical protein